MTDLTGQTVGSYRLRSLIGEGGMGAVYLGEHRSLLRKAAIKILKAELLTNQSAVKRFMEEARAASAVTHPNIVDVQDVGTLEGGQPYMIMEFLPGQSLGQRLARDRTIPVEEAVDIAIQAAGALEVVHARGIIHRDLKPDNLFLTPDSLLRFGLRVKVLDFGVAKLRGDLALEGGQTKNGALLGTPLYMSPEQCRGQVEEIDARTDVYALGVILYQMLSGTPPFPATNFGDLLMLHMTAPPPPLAGRVPSLDPALERAVLKTLAKRREDRFATMAELMAELRQSQGLGRSRTLVLPDAVAAGGPSLAGGPGGTKVLDEAPRPQSTLSGSAGSAGPAPRSTSSAWRAALAGIAATGLIGAGGWWWLGRELAPEPVSASAPAVERASAVPPAPVTATVPTPGPVEELAPAPEETAPAPAVNPAPPQTSPAPPGASAVRARPRPRKLAPASKPAAVTKPEPPKKIIPAVPW